MRQRYTCPRVGLRTVGACEPRQIRKEAALSIPFQVCGSPGPSSRRPAAAAGHTCLNRTVAALYRKYRPQTFAEVVGQEAIVRTLKNAITAGSVRQAYLFAGPRGTGKTSMARILAKSLNCTHGPTATPDGTCHACVAIAAGTSLDVIEMDAASQRGIDDIREIRDRVVLQPVEGKHKIYILDEAHQLTDAAWNALLKLIEEPPPHLVFVFCTTDLSKVLPTVRSRCQTFVFQRPRLQDILTVLTRVAEGEKIDAPQQALSLVARSARGSFRDATSTLDQLSAATEGTITVQSVLQLLGTVEEEALFRLCDLIVDHDTAGALTFVEELSEQGHDLGRLVTELIEHLRHLMLVQHMGEVPESLPVTEETRERLRAQANQVGEPTVVRLLDLLAVAVDDMRQGGDPRLPLELALVKVTRPASDLARESVNYRLEQLEQRGPTAAPPAVLPAPGRQAPAPAPAFPAATTAAETGGGVATAAPPTVELEQLQEAWQRTIVPAVAEKSIPISTVLGEARPAELSGNTLTVEFPASASFHRQLAEEPKNATMLADALYEVTGRRLVLAFAVGDAEAEGAGELEGPAGEDRILELLKNDLGAVEREEKQ